MSLICGEAVDAAAGICLARVEPCGRPFGLVRGVGIVLGLEAYSGVAGILDALLADRRAVEEIAGVKLDSGLRGVDAEGDAGSGGCESGRLLGDVALGVEHPVVVVALAENDLLVVDGVGVSGGDGEG